MNYKEKLKIDLEKTIDAYNSPIINIDDVKSKLTFNTNPIEEPVKSKPKRKVLFPIWMCASLLVGIGVGTGITYAVSRETDKNESTYKFFEEQIFDQKRAVFSELNRNVFDECTAFMTTHLIKQFMNSEIINDTNANSIEKIYAKNDYEFTTEKCNSIDLVYSNFILCSKDNSDYFYFMGYKEKEIVRYRVKSNLPYTTNQLKENMPLNDALMESGSIRLRPILMTTLTTILSMIPMIFTQNENAAMMKGMSLIIIGGLITSTMLILLLLPSFYLLMSRQGRMEAKERRKQKRAARRENKGKKE